MIILWILLLCGLVFIGIDYGRLIAKSRRIEQELVEDIELNPYTPTRYIMICAESDSCLLDLAEMAVRAHLKSGIKVMLQTDQEKSRGCITTIFGNGDELIVYDYNIAKFEKLTKDERDNYAQRIFFDHKLPEGAERAIIEKLGLVDYMISVGICTKKSGGK